MIRDILLVFSIVMILVAYLKVFIVYFKKKKQLVKDINGFELAKEITSNYDEINIVESRKLKVSKYYLKRNIIRLTPRDYEGNSVYILGITSLLAGYSLVNIHKNQFIKIFGKIFPWMDYLDYSGIVVLVISIFTNTVGDAKIGLILLGVILMYQYFRLQIHDENNTYVEGDLSDQYFDQIKEVREVFGALLKISFIVTLVLMLREIMIILNI